jgi:hypothetical protein
MNETLTFADLQDAGNAQAQLVLYAIARNVDWETGEGYPKQATLARMAKCCPRTLRTYLRKLADDGLIEVSERKRDDGGQSSNLIRLVGYAEWIGANRSGGSVRTPKAVKKYTQPPQANIATGEGEIADPHGNDIASPPGNMVATLNDPSLDHKSIKDARDRAQVGNVCSEVKASPRFEITPNDAQWKAWLDHLRETAPDKLADAEAAGRLTATGSKWPDKGKLVYVPSATLTQRSKAMQGDAA